jgi:hypothetical protein
MKILDHTLLLQIDSNRDLFTKHGLHMNDKGKELAAKKIASTVKYMLQEKITEPMCMTWKDDDVKYHRKTTSPRHAPFSKATDVRIKIKTQLQPCHHEDFENHPLQEGMIFYGWETAK